ncbi:MAG: 50S ribosomal protein L17 [Candidatus Neomarinimicrobiota bacterium]
MRHAKLGRKLGRKTASRKALMMNLASSLIEHKKIKTTDAKAKELRRFIEPLITFAKKGDIHSRRQVLKKIPHKTVVRELFDKIAPQYAERKGGYTRIIKLGFRENDCAPISLIEFVDFLSNSVEAG